MFKWKNHSIKLMMRVLPFYFLGRGHAPSPKIVKFDITYRCHLRCEMCFYWSQQASFRMKEIIQGGQKELTFSEIKNKLIPQLNETGIKYLSITGGEPFLKENIYDILALFGKQGFKFSLNSNLPNVGLKEAEYIVKANISNIQLSLHGPSKIHNLISGKEDVFEDVVSAIECIKKCRKNFFSINSPSLTVCCVVSSSNQKYLFETFKLVEELGVDNLFFHFMEWQDMDSLMKSDETFRARMTEKKLLSIDEKIIMDEIKKIMSIKKYSKINVFFHPLGYPFSEKQLRRWYKDPSFSIVKKCFYLWMETRIDPYGWILPCYYLDRPIGNIKNENILEIWKSTEYKMLRRKISNNFSPMCYKCCKLSRKWQNLLFHL